MVVIWINMVEMRLRKILDVLRIMYFFYIDYVFYVFILVLEYENSVQRFVLCQIIIFVEL